MRTTGWDRCDRAREWVSLLLDDELSEFENALLDAHLAGCADCRAFRAGAASSTATLRHHPHVPFRPCTPGSGWSRRSRAGRTWVDSPESAGACAPGAEPSDQPSRRAMQPEQQQPAGRNVGKVVEIKGVVIDSLFAARLPEIYT